MTTLEDVASSLQEVEDCRDDPEAAHMAEDSFWLGVLTAIACGDLHGDAAQQACLMAISSVRIEFSRWYA